MTFAARRPGRKSGPWSLPVEARFLRQPQDGAQESSSRIAAIASHLHNGAFREPEDARLTGGTRSLMRRVLGLNVMTQLRKGPDAIVPSERANVA